MRKLFISIIILFLFGCAQWAPHPISVDSSLKNPRDIKIAILSTRVEGNPETLINFTI